MKREGTEEMALAILCRVLRSMGWHWHWIRRYLGIGFAQLHQLRARHGLDALSVPVIPGRIIPPSPSRLFVLSWPRWESEDEFDQWFVATDPASPFKRRGC